MILLRAYNQTKYGTKNTSNASNINESKFTLSNWHYQLATKFNNRYKTYYGMIPWTVRTNV